MFQGFLKSPKAMYELGNYLRTIQPVMTDPNIPREQKREALCTMVDSLSEKTFKNAVALKSIMVIINMKEEECKLFSDTQVQVDSILTWLPRMKEHQDKLFNEVKEHRIKYGLNI
jgi:hypothetical protein